MSVSIRFDIPRAFDPKQFSGLEKVCGLYFIFLSNGDVRYPFKLSKLIYIGMSEKRTNSIASRLLSHFDGSSRNVGISNYRKADTLRFTYLNIDVLQSLWDRRIEDLESYFILDFVKQYGVYPICNNKSTFPDFDNQKHGPMLIDWDYFSS